jgi:hypothetical protein
MTLDEWKALRPGQIIFYGKNGIARIVEHITERGIEVASKINRNSVTTYGKGTRNLFSLKPHHTLQCDNGWLSPEGELYPCTFATHLRLAEIIEKMIGGIFDHRYMEKIGWIKLSITQAGWYQWLPENANPTQTQIDTIYDWCRLRGAVLPPFLNNKGI